MPLSIFPTRRDHSHNSRTTLKPTVAITQKKRFISPPGPLQGSGRWFSAGDRDPEWHRSVPNLDDYRSSSSLRSISIDDKEEKPEMSLPVDPSRHKLWYYSSNHVLVNKERTRRATAPVIRNRELDEIAREHAEFMASIEEVRHANPLKIQTKLGLSGRKVGSNVAKGESIREMHKSMMKKSITARNNILNGKYTSFGMGTATTPSGELYICQIFI